MDKRRIGKFWSIILVFLLSNPRGSESAESCNSEDRSSLLAFKAGFIDKMGVFSSWTVSEDCCHWTGVNCSSTGRVQGLTVQSGNLSGPVPSVLGNLSFLANLDLSDNFWTGGLPERLSNLTALNSLDLSQNELDGGVPVSLLILPNLKSLNLSWNSFSSELPSGSFNSTLEQLFLQGNDLHGSISSSFLSSLGKLRYLNLGNNNISGSIPSSIGNLMRYLVTLDLSKNHLSGVIPLSLSRLAYLNLSQNMLTGTIPSFGNSSFIKPISNLFLPPSLDLSNNSLTGILPRNLFNASGMVQLKVGNNHLTGEIPDFFGSCDLLQSLSLHNNQFQGNLPASLQNCSNLEVLDLSWNELSGSLPSWLKNFAPSLRVFILGSNNFYGVLPEWFSNFTSLQVLDLSDNRFSGPIPPNLNQLEGLLQPGQFLGRGTLYDEEIQITAKNMVLDLMYLLSATTSLDLSGNDIGGSIPQQLGDLKGLLFLNLARNNLSGMIPTTLANMAALESLDLSTNQLNGPIPSQIALDLTALEYLNVSSNFLSGEIPYEKPPFTTFSASSFMDNPSLCGPPLLVPCPSLQHEPPSSAPSRQESFTQEWLSIPAFGVGVAIGFFVLSSFLFPLAYESGKQGRLAKTIPICQEHYGV